MRTTFGEAASAGAGGGPGGEGWLQSRPGGEAEATPGVTACAACGSEEGFSLAGRGQAGGTGAILPQPASHDLAVE